MLLLGLFDLALLLIAGETAWQVRASQIATDIGPLGDRLAMLATGATRIDQVIWTPVAEWDE